MTRPEYRDPWAPRDFGPVRSGPRPELVRLRVYNDPVCQHRDAGAFCRGLAVSAVVVPNGDPRNVRAYRSRCAGHAAPDAPRLCLGCHRANTGPDDNRCTSCLHRRTGGADNREVWR